VLTTEQQADVCIVHLSGHWTVERLADIEKALAQLPATVPKALVDCSQLQGADLSAMWLLRNRLDTWQTQGAQISYAPAAPEHFQFLSELQSHTVSSHVEHEAELLWPEQMVASFGKRAVELGHHALGHLEHFGRIITTQSRALLHPKHLRSASIVRHVYETGVQALPIVSLISFFVAIIIAYIGASQLTDFGAGIYTVDLITIGVLRELGVLITAVIVAGRSGSAFAAEIGVMQLNDEVDALKSIGLDPIEVLVAPRVLGLIIALPLLTIVSDMMGMAGGALLTRWLLDIPMLQYMARVQEALAPTTFWAGLIKAPVFAFLIGMIGTYRGMQVRDSSRELGRLTTTAVVESIFMVIFANAIFAVVYVELDF
jgi:phospholipid/cholesterol/gamma-HCH transport system permease protein